MHSELYTIVIITLVYLKLWDFIKNYGIDPDGPLPDDEDNEVVVPTTPCPLDSDQYDDLVLAVDPLSRSDNYGIDVYLQVYT